MFTDITTLNSMGEVIVEFSAYATLVLMVLLVSTVWMIKLAHEAYHCVIWGEFLRNNKIFLVLAPVLFCVSLFFVMMVVTYAVFFI